MTTPNAALESTHTHPGNDFQLSVCAEMVYLELPLLERIRRIHHEHGLAVDLWTSDHLDLTALKATGARFSSMIGYRSGSLVDPESCDAVVNSAEQMAQRATELGIPRLVLHPAEMVNGVAKHPIFRPTGIMWMTALRALERIAVTGERYNVQFCLENLNTVVDHPGIPLARLADTSALVSAVQSPHLGLMLDLYHVQLTTGNILTQLEAALPWAGEIQVADVPGRKEPGTGEINFPAVARLLRACNYNGAVGFEGYPSGDSDKAVTAFVEAFS